MATSENLHYPAAHVVESENATFVEPVSFAVASFISKNKYNPVYLGDVEPEASGIDPLDLPQDQLGFTTMVIYEKIGVIQDYLVGRIEFTNTGKIPELADKDWIIYVYGRNDVPDILKLASGLESKFDKKIGLYLESQSRKVFKSPN